MATADSEFSEELIVLSVLLLYKSNERMVSIL